MQAVDFTFQTSGSFAHSFTNNVIFARSECQLTCTESYAVVFGGREGLRATGNRVFNAYMGMLFMRGTCDGVQVWEDNVMSGNRHGFHFRTNGCASSLRLESYRNQIGVSADSSVSDIRGILGRKWHWIFEPSHVWWPEVKLPLEWRWSRVLQCKKVRLLLDYHHSLRRNVKRCCFARRILRWGPYE